MPSATYNTLDLRHYVIDIILYLFVVQYNFTALCATSKTNHPVSAQIRHGQRSFDYISLILGYQL